jgi:pseudomonalisin
VPALILLVVAIFVGPLLCAQTANQVTQDVDARKVRALPNHHPSWANPNNAAGSIPANLMLDQMTMVLSRSSSQQLALESFLADQQDPASPDYHHWLTPTEMGERFGLSAQDIQSVTGWLQSEGLLVKWVSPGRTFIGFTGTAADVDRAFKTEMHYYAVDGKQRVSVSSDPMIPEALSPVIKAVRGLYTIEEQPQHHIGSAQSVSPAFTYSPGSYYFIAPADFATIYDLPSNLTGADVTIGIVGESRTNFADFVNFRALTGSTFHNPTEIVPTAYGGVDPGPACTSSPCALSGVQGEATLDVFRSGSVAPGANLLLVVATAASGGIGADAQYLVNTEPVPAQVMSISFGFCESAAGKSAVDYWDTLFQTAAAEGISVFVASGDSGASGCDTAFATPPASPAANSPNYICSSSYATCVGGTEFNDASDYFSYWSSSNGSGLSSALSYIPEGGWNEPLNSSSNTQVAASGGGVSAFIATPSWQTGTGVPAARAGRYTPDVSFSASGHDGYFGCFAAEGGSCVITNGSYTFEYFYGTSAAAPSMAGITALLDQKMKVGLGNLNPQLYQMVASTPAAFHDVTVATSGVTGCSINTPSMCNNSIPGPTGLSGGQAGFPVTVGYDEVTGLGSLDVQVFLSNFPTSKATMISPTPSSTLTGATQTFTWTKGIGVAQAWIWIGTTTGGQNLGAYGGAGVTSATPTNLPTNGSTVCVRLWSLISGAWLYNDYSYTAATSQATMVSPTPGSTLTGATQTFTWTKGIGVAQAWIWIGTTAGGQNLGSYGGAGVTSATPTNLPTNGSTVYVRLWSLVSGAWLYNDYSYTAATSQATMVSPTPGSTLTGATQTFTWTTGIGVAQAWIWIGTTAGGQNLGSYGGAGVTSATPTNLPTNGSTVYVRLWSLISGAWLYNDYTYTAF